MIHELPVPTAFFRAIAGRRLTFLLVLHGSRFQLHDTLRLRDVGGNEYCYVQVTFIIADPAQGLRDGYAAIAFKVKILSSEIDVKALKK